MGAHMCSISAFHAPKNTTFVKPSSGLRQNIELLEPICSERVYAKEGVVSAREYQSQGARSATEPRTKGGVLLSILSNLELSRKTRRSSGALNRSSTKSCSQNPSHRDSTFPVVSPNDDKNDNNHDGNHNNNHNVSIKTQVARTTATHLQESVQLLPAAKESSVSLRVEGATVCARIEFALAVEDRVRCGRHKFPVQFLVALSELVCQVDSEALDVAGCSLQPSVRCEPCFLLLQLVSHLFHCFVGLRVWTSAMQVVPVMRFGQQQHTDFGECAQVDEATFERLAKPSVVNQRPPNHLDE